MPGSWERPVSGWPVWAWIMTAMIPVVALVAVLAGVLSPGLALDTISLWPGLSPALAALIVVAFRKSWSRRAGALPPLLVLTWMGLSTAAHLSGWPVLPSSSAELTGPVVPSDSPGGVLVTLDARPSGLLRVESGSDQVLYQVRFVRTGGPVGVPAASEVSDSQGLAITVNDKGTTEWFRYAGWNLSLSPQSVWDLSLGGEVSGDLSDVEINSLAIEGSGNLILGVAGRRVPVSVRGSFELVIPANVAATVVGPASVPPDWKATEEGFAAPVVGPGWMISVEVGASLVITEG